MAQTRKEKSRENPIFHLIFLQNICSAFCTHRHVLACAGTRLWKICLIKKSTQNHDSKPDTKNFNFSHNFWKIKISAFRTHRHVPARAGTQIWWILSERASKITTIGQNFKEKTQKWLLKQVCIPVIFMFWKILILPRPLENWISQLSSAQTLEWHPKMRL